MKKIGFFLIINCIFVIVNGQNTISKESAENAKSFIRETFHSIVTEKCVVNENQQCHLYVYRNDSLSLEYIDVTSDDLLTRKIEFKNFKDIVGYDSYILIKGTGKKISYSASKEEASPITEMKVYTLEGYDKTLIARLKKAMNDLKNYNDTKYGY